MPTYEDESGEYRKPLAIHQIFLQAAPKVCRFVPGVFVIGVDVCLSKRKEENHDATVCALATQ
jgi:hypothetical protein